MGFNSAFKGLNIFILEVPTYLQ